MNRQKNLTNEIHLQSVPEFQVYSRQPEIEETICWETYITKAIVKLNQGNIYVVQSRKLIEYFPFFR